MIFKMNNNNDDDEFVCSNCAYTSNFKQNVKRHEKKCLLKEKPILKCEKCELECSTKWQIVKVWMPKKRKKCSVLFTLIDRYCKTSLT